MTFAWLLVSEASAAPLTLREGQRQGLHVSSASWPQFLYSMAPAV
jgi:hypothetical protein